MEMEYQVKGPYLIIQVGKELDHHQAEHIRQVLERIGRERDIRNIIFDFTKTTFMDSSGAVSYTHLDVYKRQLLGYPYGIFRN